MKNTIITVFSLATMDTQKYNQAIRDLEASGQGKPSGRLYHVAARQEDGSIIVTDIWESAAFFEDLGKTWILILNKAGVTPVEPKVYSVHNVIKG